MTRIKRPTQTSAIQDPQTTTPVEAVELTDRRFIYFVDPYGTKVPRVVLIVCMEHAYASSASKFINSQNHIRGDRLKGLPDRSNMSICARNDVIGKTRYITGSSIEGFVALNNRGGTEEEIVRENAIQIIETLEMYFITAREAFRKSEWNYKGISKVLGDAFIDLPKYLWLRLF